MVKFGIERLIVEKRLYRYPSKGLMEDKLEKKIAEVGLNAYGYKQKFEFRSEWATLSLVETSRTDAGCGIGPFGAAPLTSFILLSLSPRNHELMG